jgi:hypothetical protein
MKRRARLALRGREEVKGGPVVWSPGAAGAAPGIRTTYDSNFYVIL